MKDKKRDIKLDLCCQDDCCAHKHKQEEVCCQDDCCSHDHHHGDCCNHEHNHDEFGDECCHIHGCECCSCGHDHGHEKVVKLWGCPIIVYRIVISIAILISTFFFEGMTNLILSLIGAVLIGFELVFEALKGIVKGKIFNESVLMITASVGAFIIGEYNEALAILVFYQVGETLQDWAIKKSEKNIHSLMKMTPEIVHVMVDGKTQDRNIRKISVGDCIEVRMGELIPIDAQLESDYASVDVSALTGESLPRECAKGEELPSGAVNLTDVIRLRVSKSSEDSTLQKLLKLLKNVSQKKSKSEKFISKFAKVYTPIVITGAFLLAIVPLFFTGFNDISKYIYRAITFLVLSCPCALVISVPLSFFSGIGASSKMGVLLKGGNIIEALSKAETVVFDKTGTLTKGEFSVIDIIPNENVTKTELLKICASLEQISNHPIARSIVNEFSSNGKDYYKVSESKEIVGYGIIGNIGGKKTYCGKYQYLIDNNISFKKLDEENYVGNEVFICQEDECLGYIVVGDTIKKDSIEGIEKLKKMGIAQTVMLTGDTYKSAKIVADQLGIDRVIAQLLPENKVEEIEKLIESKTEKRSVVFVGDGFNDAPVMARADIGIAMGGIGSDATIEVADAVIMTDEPSKIASLIKLCRKVMRIVKSNIIFALAVKFGVLGLGLFGLASMWLAVFADVGVSIICVINSLRALFIKAK